jgi:uncharacterized caspase-like protein
MPTAALLLLTLTATVGAAGDGDDDGARGFKAVVPEIDEPRHALVIGNGAYAAGPLNNATHDAQLVAASLRSVGFHVVERHDLNRDGMLRAIRAFGEELRDGGVGLFYFAGHGVQVDGRSYLVPIDARVRVSSDVTLEAVDAGHVLARMEEANNRLNLVVLDACRNNPLPKATRTSGGGLAFLQAPTGVLIAYATAPGQVAADGAGSNSVYSKAFAEELRTPGARVEDVFKRVRGRTREATGGAQIPWESSSLEGDFFFVAPGETPPPLDLSVPADAPAAVLGAFDDSALGGLVGNELGRDDAEPRKAELEDELAGYRFWSTLSLGVSGTLFSLACVGGLIGAPFLSRDVLAQLGVARVSTGDGSLDSLLLLGTWTGTADLGTHVLAGVCCGGAVAMVLGGAAVLPAYWWSESNAEATYDELRRIDPTWGDTPEAQVQAQAF